jgi:uncharacterized NAD(P)/FAD-binding protein YdhS
MKTNQSLWIALLITVLAACTSSRPVPQQSTYAPPPISDRNSAPVGDFPREAVLVPANPQPGELINQERQELISQLDGEIKALDDQIRSTDDRYREINREARDWKKRRDKLRRQQNRLEKQRKDLQKNDPREQWQQKKADIRRSIDEANKERQTN